MIEPEKYTIKDPPPMDFCMVIVYEITLSKSKVSIGSISDKNLSVPRGNFLKYFMRIILFIELCCSKSATLQVSYDMKNKFPFMFYLINPQTIELKTIHTYIRI